MKVIGIKHKFGAPLGDLFSAVEEAVELAGDGVVVGPDYAFSQTPIRDTYDMIARRLCAITEGRKSLVIPGTVPLIVGEARDHMSVVAHAFLDGKVVKEFVKETDRGDSLVAEKAGVVYQKGNFDLNNVRHGKGNVAVEICSDHGDGRQRIPMDTWLEVIMCYDRNGGFYHNSRNMVPHRSIMICNSDDGSVEMQRIDNKGLNIVKSVKQNSRLRIYDVK